jgi:hypothetical protein
MIRYFATTDDSDTGRVALAYLKSLLRLGPVRLVSVSGSLGVRWEAFTPLMGTMLAYPYVSVVCCVPGRWTWLHRVAMPCLDKHGQVIAMDHAAERLELYTAGMRNVLLAACPPPSDPQVLQDTLATALRYQAFVVPTQEVADQWAGLDCHPRVISVMDHVALRDAIHTRR